MERISQLTLSPLLSKIPGLAHGFTNLSLPKTETDALDQKTATAKQVHGDKLVWTDHFEKREREADGIATFTPGLAVGVYSADCTPLLTVAVEAGTQKPFAIMAVHAGWRGTALGIGGKSLRAFIDEVSRKQGGSFRFVCAIGPCIGPQSFEVGEDVVQAFPQSEERGLAKFLRMEGDKKKYLFDLPGENLRQLEAVKKELREEITIDSLGLCTLERKSEFPSFRRDREKAGRILSFLSFRG
jgi:polyphenol oxidase